MTRGYVTTTTRGALATTPRSDGTPVPEADVIAKIAEARRVVGAAQDALDCGMFAVARLHAGCARAAMRILAIMYPTFHDEAKGLAREAGEIINCCLIEEELAPGR